MNPIKIEIAPEVHDFNHAVEMADILTDYKFDRESVAGLLEGIEHEQCYPHYVQFLKETTAKLAIKRLGLDYSRGSTIAQNLGA